ncbi:MAG TPA: 2,3-diaminopropionate biosynthesis protein SbnA [Kineosporiaceae bacterium]
MPIVKSIREVVCEDVFVKLPEGFGAQLYLKVEGFNLAQSIKLKSALEMVEQAERVGRLRPGQTIVESSSGNMGVALALVAVDKGYSFRCVTDTRCAEASRRIMTALGAEVEVVTEPLPDGGLLGARLQRVGELCRHPDMVWLNQYTNPANWQAHYRRTAPAVAAAFPHLDVLFVGAGTTGTLMGCARYFREHRPSTKVVAVDSYGSVTFGGEPGVRRIPGLGTSVRPAILDPSFIDDVVHVSEVETIRACRELSRAGLLLGGSTGSVVAGARRWLGLQGEGLSAVAISPDLGERYLETIYDDAWVMDNYGPAALAAWSDVATTGALAAASGRV